MRNAKSQFYYIKTFGCQMNVSDSERIATVLENNGLKEALNINEADLVVFNTCGVRQMAEDRVYGQIHNLAARSPKPITVVTGCLANRKDVQRRLRGKVDLFCEIKDFAQKMPEFVIASETKQSRSKETRTEIAAVTTLLRNDIRGKDYFPPKSDTPKAGKIIKLSPNQEDIAYLSINPKHGNNFRAYVPIMTGCNNFCSYCVVPYARGREVSRPTEEIIKEVKNLVKNGYKEIILLGQNVNSYKNNKINFSQLIKKINAIPGHFWISFISNHPKDVTDEMIKTVANLSKVCECFHLPLQSGNDEIIQKMNRKYTGQQYLNLIKKIKSAYKKYKPDKLFSITSDIIVGFPGETKKQLSDSAEVMKKANYDMVYFGQYSPRPGTAAWKLKDNVSKPEKMRREKYLNEILKKTAFDNNHKYVGKDLEVLVDNKKGEFYFGRTRTMKNVKITTTKKGLVGKFAKIKITKASVWNLEGIICHPTGGRP